MVTHSATSLPIGAFSTADRTGCAVLHLLWPYAWTDPTHRDINCFWGKLGVLSE